MDSNTTHVNASNLFNRSMVYVVVPGTPNPKNPVQLGMLLPLGELSILE